MKRLIATLTIGILVLSFVASLAGALSYRNQQYRTITTARGEVVEVADGGVYRYSLRSLVTGGTPWDVVWLGLAIPILGVAFVLHARGSPLDLTQYAVRRSQRAEAQTASRAARGDLSSWTTRGSLPFGVTREPESRQRLRAPQVDDDEDVEDGGQGGDLRSVERRRLLEVVLGP